MGLKVSTVSVGDPGKAKNAVPKVKEELRKARDDLRDSPRFAYGPCKKQNLKNWILDFIVSTNAERMRMCAEIAANFKHAPVFVPVRHLKKATGNATQLPMPS